DEAVRRVWCDVMAGGRRRDGFAEGARDDGDIRAVRKRIVVYVGRPSVLAGIACAGDQGIRGDHSFVAVCPAVAVAVGGGKCWSGFAGKTAATKNENGDHSDAADDDVDQG